MFRSPAAALLRRLAPRLSGGTVGSGSSTRRTLPPHIAPSVPSRFSSTPTSSPPPSSSVGERDDEAEDHELPGAPENSGARLSISVDRSGLYSPPVPTIIVAHEFFDALPIHQFQVSEQFGFRFRFVLSPQPTASLIFLSKHCQWASSEELEKVEQIEVCPKAMEITEQIADRISSDGGGAIIVDYGKNGIVSDSLQAIRKHKFVHILDGPGSADLSAYVDFAAIKHSAEEVSDDISVHGPMTQSQLLGSLGINFRVEALMQNCDEKQAESLRTGYWRLVGDGEAPFWEGPDDQTPIGMGTRYLAMAIVNKKQGSPVPFE
ncbi:hypothetical protein ACQ4PT_070158 [Festuca glaucescens]